MRVAAIFSLELMIAVLTFTSQQKERLIVQLYVIISLACVVGIWAASLVIYPTLLYLVKICYCKMDLF